ncbi:MAG: prephenate dehydrogenase/arogenate dehydrogenase family protein, partial [Planctomycetota bacterium]
MTPLPGIRNLTVVGTGLLGTAVGLSARQARLRTVAYDSNHAHATRAMQRGAFDAAEEDLAKAVAGADLIVLAVPIGVARDVLKSVADAAPESALITDTLSTKSSICAAADEFGLAARFVGAHPMAGSHRSGPDAATPDLLPGATCHLIDAPAIDKVEAFWSAVGCRVERWPV